VTQEPGSEHVDVVIIGAGISGIAAAVELQRRLPDISFLLLEMRDSIGGTWDLFRYPGVRSDSDMFTLGYSFKPWTDTNGIAEGDQILAYLHDTIDEFGLRDRIRLGCRVRRADWSSTEGAWQLEIESRRADERLSCTFLYTATGYYNYDHGFAPEFPGADRFDGVIVHPQRWPENLDYAGRRVAVIGSGATAITLVPSLAREAELVTMVQRSPTYVVIEDGEDEEACLLRQKLGPNEAFQRIRQRNLGRQQEFYEHARTEPEEFKRPIFEAIEAIVGRKLREQHFTPTYQPWDQRLCLVPNGDLFWAIRDGAAQVVTGHIETFTHQGIRMQSGEHVDADIIVTATGLDVVTLGQVAFTVDGEPVDFSQTWTYRGIGFSGVPNLVNAFGYINSSWTLRIELVNEFWCAVLERMRSKGARQVVPTLRPEDETMSVRPWIADVTSGYLVRASERLPRQGDHSPWINPQIHEATKALLTEDPDDGVLVYSS
jgi:monooxygenase